MTTEEMKKRTKRFGIAVIELCALLPDSLVAQVIGKQLLKSGTSVGANYRAACRAKSKADFISKLGIVEEETDESAYWLEVLTEAGILPAGATEGLIKEANEILSIVVSSIKTAKDKDPEK